MCAFNDLADLSFYSLVFGFWFSLGASAAFLVVSYVFNIVDNAFID